MSFPLRTGVTPSDTHLVVVAVVVCLHGSEEASATVQMSVEMVRYSELTVRH